MLTEELERAYDSLLEFHSRFGPYFGRSEVRAHTQAYLRGLLVRREERRNAENLAEGIEGETARGLQRMLTESGWEVQPVIGEMQAYLHPILYDPEGIDVIDESAFVKKGKHSVGVGRQWCGRLGKVENCQVGVLLAHVSSQGHALLDAELFLPEEWSLDPQRCRAAGVPEEVICAGHRTKPQIGLELLRRSRERGQLSGKWVTADEHYGQSPQLREGLEAAGRLYVVEVGVNQHVYEPVPQVGCTGRQSKPRVLEPEAKARSVQEVAAGIPEQEWRAIVVGEGSQGPREFQFAARRVLESREGLPGRESWLVLRRNLDGSEPKYYLSNAPTDTRLEVLAKVGSARCYVESCILNSKHEVGLDEYEVRSWRGWHHHVTLVLLACALLLGLQQEWGEKYAPVDAAAGGEGAGGATTQAAFYPSRVAAVVGADATAQRARETFPRQTQTA